MWATLLETLIERLAPGSSTVVDVDAIGAGQRSAGHEVALHVDDEQGTARIDDLEGILQHEGST